ncbi:MAG: prepilin-type N-terminal cleavage/methylation domain-containing protein [Planctomycetota bacterium]
MQARSGLTILELLVVLVLVALAAGLAIPAYFERSEVTLERASILLARDLRMAQNRSAYLEEPCRVWFREDGDGYRVTNHAGAIIRNPGTNQPFERRFSVDAVFRGVRIVEARFGPDRFLSYDERGLPREEGQITLWFAGDTRTVHVERRAGKIEILGATSGWTDPGY